MMPAELDRAPSTGFSARASASVGEPVRLTFRDAKGQLIQGMSEPVPRHAIITLRVEAWNPCGFHRVQNRKEQAKGLPLSLCVKRKFKARDRANRRCTGPILSGVREGPANLATKQWAQFNQVLILASSQTIADTGAVGRAITNGTATGTLNLVAGTGSAAATDTDTNLQAQSTGTNGSQAGTVTAYVSGGTSGTFTITATITNTSGAAIAYRECGVEITVGGNVFLLAHDIFAAALNVSNNGTLALTYTITNS